jgi:hypothetical protein
LSAGVSQTVVFVEWLQRPWRDAVRSVNAVYLVAGGYSFFWIGALFAVAVDLSLLTEWLLPYEQTWSHAHADAAKDVAHGVIYEIFSACAPHGLSYAPWRIVSWRIVSSEADRRHSGDNAR